METFTKRLKELREEKGLTTLQLGKELGFSNASISRWENGERIPNIKVLVEVAKFFKVSTDYLCGLED